MKHKGVCRNIFSCFGCDFTSCKYTDWIYLYKLADDQQIRRKNTVYEQQLELCERHQEETELAMLQMRDVKHNMKNNLILLLAYAEQRECEKMIDFINDIMEEGRLKTSKVATTGNIVIDSLVEYWRRTAEKEEIEFQAELSIPMEMPFKGADISLILGNLFKMRWKEQKKLKSENT